MPRHLLVCLLCALVWSDTPKEAPPIEGRLDVSPATGDRPPEVSIQVGPTRYLLALDAPAVGSARKLRGKYVTIAGRRESTGKHAFQLHPEAGATVTLQKPRAVTGMVRATKIKKKKTSYKLVTDDKTTIAIAAADGRRFKKFIDNYVAAEGHMISDGTFRQLAAVRSVAATPPPGARKLKKVTDALTGTWKGTMVTTEVPSGVPGANVGDKFAIAFVANEGLKSAAGRLFDTYDINGVRGRKFSVKKRTVSFDVNYTFGSGTYTARLEGTFTPDFKQIAGTWGSGFLGKGTFVIDWVKPRR